jgi:hypothetical protein
VKPVTARPSREEKPTEKEEKSISPPAKPTPTPALESTDDKEIDRLVTELVQAPADKQEALIETLKERKGVAHTEALARAIPQLTGPTKLKARDALAERLTRMTNSTLREKLQDESTEVRRAATLACAMKEDKTFVPDLIARLDDAQRTVSLAAHAALKALTQKDFGPATDATPRERAGAMVRWKEWWKRQEGAK